MYRISNLLIYITLWFSIFVLAACESEREQEGLAPQAYQFSLEQALDSDSANLGIDRIFKLKRAFFLEFPKNRPIQNIHKIVVSEPSLFILDNVQNYIFVYDLQGNYLNRIGAIGDGPGEYLDITDFSFRNDELIVFSNSSRKIIHYNLTGALIKEIPIVFYGASVATGNDGYVLLTKNNVHHNMPYDLIFLNASGKKIDQKQKINSEIPSFQSSGFIYKPKDMELRYMKMFDDKIYEITQDFDLLPLYEFDLGSSALDIEKFKNPQELLAHFHEYTHLTQHYWENESLVLLYFHHELKRSFGLVSKSEMKFYTENMFRSSTVIEILRSIRTAALSGNRLFVSTHPVYYTSEYNFEAINSLITWDPDVSDQVSKSDLIENSNGVIFEIEVVN